MSRTIQVKEDVYRLLARLKKQMEARSFSEVIQRLALRELGLTEEMFGVDKGKIAPFTERDRMEDRGW
ncbi:VapB-type antitoxin [Candidatus Bathyarchaeota archaeon]|nr:VapB-type antitoxin [Candidatus Bathyarchaeota archaeon]